MATIKVKDQARLPYRSVSIAQINDALSTYEEDQTIVAGLTALKSAKNSEMTNWPTCVQCSGQGTIESKAIICPLCQGEGKTEKTYQPERGPVTGFTEVEL